MQFLITCEISNLYVKYLEEKIKHRTNSVVLVKYFYITFIRISGIAALSGPENSLYVYIHTFIHICMETGRLFT